jgi:hypothetical protein
MGLLLLIVVLVILGSGAYGTWGPRPYAYGPGISIFGLILLVLLIALLANHTVVWW